MFYALNVKILLGNRFFMRLLMGE